VATYHGGSTVGFLEPGAQNALADSVNEGAASASTFSATGGATPTVYRYTAGVSNIVNGTTGETWLTLAPYYVDTPITWGGDTRTLPSNDLTLLGLDASDSLLFATEAYKAIAVNIVIPGVASGDYTASYWASDSVFTTPGQRVVELSWMQGAVVDGNVDISVGGNDAIVRNVDITVTDEGGGIGTFRLDVNAVVDFPNIVALRLVLGQGADVEAPTVPILQASPLNFHEVVLAISAPADNVGVVTRTLYQDGVEISTIPPETTSQKISNLTLDTAYNYVVRDTDAAGNSSESIQQSAITASDIRIDSGQLVDYDASTGFRWYGDTAINGAVLNGNVTTAQISGTADPLLYQSIALEAIAGNSFGYEFPLPVGDWRAVCHFAEFDPGVEIGERIIGIGVAGVTVEAGLDVLDEAGLETALLKDYVFVSDGVFTATFSGVVGIGYVSALEVLPVLDTPLGLVSSLIAETSFRVSCTAVPGAVFYHWYRDGVFITQTQTSAFFSGVLPATAYDITVLTIDAFGYEGPISAALEVTTLAAVTPEPFQLAAVGDLSEYLRILRYGQDPATAGAVRMENFVTFQNRGNLTRLSVVKESDENENELEDITLYSQWVVELFTDTPDGTPDYTLDSTADPTYFDLTDPDAVGVYFGRYTGNIPAGRYQATMYGVDATFTDGRQVRDTFLIDHRAAS
jgi:hypothetical protein